MSAEGANFISGRSYSSDSEVRSRGGVLVEGSSQSTCACTRTSNRATDEQVVVSVNKGNLEAITMGAACNLDQEDDIVIVW